MLFQNLIPTRKLKKSIDFPFSSTIQRNQKVLHSSNENNCEGCNAPCLLSPGRPSICRMGSPASAPESAASMNIDQTYFVCTQSSAFLTVSSPDPWVDTIHHSIWILVQSNPDSNQYNLIKLFLQRRDNTQNWVQLFRQLSFTEWWLGDTCLSRTSAVRAFQWAEWAESSVYKWPLLLSSMLLCNSPQ